MNKNKKIYLLVFIIFIVSLFSNYNVIAEDKILENTIDTKSDYIYMSDVDYTDLDRYKSYTGWANIEKDKNPDGNTIKIRKDGEIVSYPKGMGFHAPGQLIYDISKYSETYTRFISKVGVDASKPDVSSITVEFLVSNDGINWISLYKTDTMSSTMDAIDLDISINGYKYLRIYTDPLGNNASDHCVLADAKFVTTDYDINSELYDKINTLEYYDNILNKNTADINYLMNRRLILEREFVNKFGFWNLQNIAATDETALDAIEWILGNDSVLEQVIEVGEISDTYKFLNSLGTLYSTYKDLLNDDTNGELYQKMMIALSAAYSTDNISSPLSFSFQIPNYDIVKRFELMKKLYENNEFTNNDQFKSLKIQLMRMVMQDAVRADETMWFSYFSDTRGEKGFYLSYISPNYNRDECFDPSRREEYDKKYNLSKYNVPFAEDRIQRYWMAYEFGGICWNTSRMGQSTYRINGIPATGVYQPGHEAFVYYNENENGEGYWKMENNIGGWGAACTKWYGGNRYRLLLDWGNKSFADQIMNATNRGNSSGYIILAQANLNNYNEFKKSSYYNLIANSYDDNNKKLEIYNKALEYSNNINLDSYDYIIKIYKDMGDSISEDEWFALANKVIDSYTLYPNAMHDLLEVIRPYLKEGKRAEIDMRETAALEKASNVTANESIQSDEVKNIANALLGKNQSQIATFSFDGEYAGEIVIGEQYSVKWSYSLDGGTTYSERTTQRAIKLSNEEIGKINEVNDIKISIEGTDMIYVIDILKANIPQIENHSYLYANDLENRVVGVDDTMEWCYNEDNNWISYKDQSPVLTGNQSVSVRVGHTKNYVPSDYETFTFTEDTEVNKNKKYIPVSHLTIKEVSTEAVNNGGRASNSIDGNYNTRWHSAWNGTDTERYIIIEIDKPVFLSAIEFVPAGGGNGRIIDGTIYGSMDGTTWEKLAENKDLQYDATHQNDYDFGLNHIKEFNIEKPKQVKYVKIVADRASGGNGNWFAARMFNLYQDITYDEHPTAGIAYSTIKPTKNDVIARLVNISPENAIITSKDNSDTYIFTQNGEFTFTFEDKLGRKGSATAVVDWIDKEIKEANVEFSTKTLTNGSVVATLKPNEEVMIINDGNYRIDEYGKIVSEDGKIVVDDFRMDENCNVINDNIITDDEDDDEQIIETIDNFKYEFLTNGTHTFYYVDRAGNIGSTTVTVDWIDNTPPEAVLTYDITHITNKDVTVKLEFNEENVKVLNNSGKDTYTFEKNEEFTFQIEDAAGNANEVTAQVDWIDKEIPEAKIKYSTTENTEGLVIATLVEPSEEITILNNNQLDSYTFTKNGTFTFIIEDKAGNRNEIKADVSWIKLNEDDDITSDEYEIDTDDKFIRKVPTNIETSEFAKNIKSRRGIVVRDRNLESVSDTTKIGTGMKVCLGEKVYTVIVSSDIDGNGILTINDLAKLCLHYIEKEKLVGESFEAADLDNNGYISINDLAKIQLLLINN